MVVGGTPMEASTIVDLRGLTPRASICRTVRDASPAVQVAPAETMAVEVVVVPAPQGTPASMELARWGNLAGRSPRPGVVLGTRSPTARPAI